MCVGLWDCVECSSCYCSGECSIGADDYCVDHVMFVLLSCVSSRGVVCSCCELTFLVIFLFCRLLSFVDLWDLNGAEHRFGDRRF